MSYSNALEAEFYKVNEKDLSRLESINKVIDSIKEEREVIKLAIEQEDLEKKISGWMNEKRKWINEQRKEFGVKLITREEMEMIVGVWWDECYHTFDESCERILLSSIEDDFKCEYCEDECECEMEIDEEE